MTFLHAKTYQRHFKVVFWTDLFNPLSAGCGVYSTWKHVPTLRKRNHTGEIEKR